MKNLINRLPYAKTVFAFCALNIVLVILVFLIKNRLPPVVPIYFGLPSGSEQLGPPESLALLPLASLIIAIINALISTFTKDEFLQKVVIGVIAATTVLSSFAYLRVFFLVGNF